MEQTNDSEMKKKILESLIQSADKMMGDKMKGKPAAMIVDIKAAHPVPEEMSSHDDEEMSGDPKVAMMKALMGSEEDPMEDSDDSEADRPHEESPMSMMSSSDEDDMEPSDELKHLIELHLMKRGKI